MNLMFWKKKASGGTAQDDAEADRSVAIPRDEETAEEHAVRPGLLARLRNALSALRKPRDSGAETSDTEAGTQKENETPAADRREDGEPLAAPPRNMKKRLIIGAALGAVILLLAGIGFASWKIFRSPPQQKLAAPATAEQPHTIQSTPHVEASQAEIAALRKKNDELQAQLEAIKKDQQQEQPPATPTPKTGGNASSASHADSGEMTVSNKDPKAAAQALKEAIEAMNAASGGQKPHKPAQ